MLSRRGVIVLAAGYLLGLSQPAAAVRPASFQAIDRNNDGKIDLDEVKQAASKKV